MTSPAGQADAFIALGANLGDRRSNLRDAIGRLVAGGDITCAARSRLYETRPVGGPPDQPDYLNAAIHVFTRLDARTLLDRCHAIESALGRRRTEPNAPREIDLDLLLYGDVVANGDDLCLPHPRMHLRRFVLVPLAEIAPHARHPLLDATVTQLRDALPPGDDVRPADPDW